MFLQCINCNKSNISCLCRNMRISASSLSSNNLVTALFICSIFILFAFSIQNIYCFCNGQWWIYLFPLLFPPKLLSGCLNQPFGKHALWENVYVSTLLKHDDQGGEGRQSKAENLRSPREIQSIFNLLGRTGKIIIFII